MRARAAAALVVLGVTAVALGVLPKAAPQRGYDAGAHIAYAEVLKTQGRLPTKAESYEYATPPAYAWLAVQLQRTADATGGLGAWRAGQLLSILWTAGLLAVAWLLGRELWPGRPWAAVLAVTATATVPIVLRLGVMFHPEMQFAFLAALGVLLVVRAERRGWPLRYGAAAGVALGLAALTRQTAVVVTASLGLAVLLAGRRRALRFAAVAAAAVAMTAGPWWGYQASRFGNPIQSNLSRYILPGGQPREFYVSAPVEDLVLHPYRPHFAGELWPQFHADLWSDWFGAQHDYWPKPPRGATAVFVSSQSVLGLVATALALGGLGGLARAGLQGLRRPEPGEGAFAGLAFLLLVLASWAAFVAQLIRFPQGGGDPIKSSYMLYLSPVFALAAVAAARRLWAGGRGWRAVLSLFAAIYAASYAGFLVTAY